jgi:hydroxymethylpyrimidine pyrophosphatase-like HAD family hydrolase
VRHNCCCGRREMRYLALATDYDGTLAEHGRVSLATLDALKRLRESGRRLILVTGRQLEDLMRAFPEYALFDRIVAENGALLFNPATREENVLGEPPPAALLQRLAASDVTPLSVGRVIVATWSPHEKAVLEAIHALGLELQVIFNKGAVMILPSGINKAFGLRAALTELTLSRHNTVAIGDAENDHALLAECEVGVAVANALPMLQERADWLTRGARGEGVRELIEELLSSDLRELEGRLTRHHLPLGKYPDGTPVGIPPYGRRVLVCGTSGSGKSTLVSAFLEGACAQGYQFCLVDPEGDFHGLAGALELGDDQSPPKSEDALAVLRSPDANLIVNLLALPLDRRSEFLITLFARCSELRASTGRPHWFVVDEAHHMLPAVDVDLPDPIARPPGGLLLITVHPDKLAAKMLEQIDTLIVVGSNPAEAFETFARALGRPSPKLVDGAELEPGEALIWTWRSDDVARRFRPAAPKGERRRHHRKYAAGALGEDKSFYFRGAAQRLNLRAHNLMLFLQIGDGVDDETWLHHLHQGDYSRWLRESIKNEALADEIAAIERDRSQTAASSRQAIREAIEKVYTLPA